MAVKIKLTIAENPLQVWAAVTGLVLINLAQLRERSFPPLYQSGVLYKREAGEDWLTIAELFALGFGDCEDLAAARCAELNHAGEAASIRVHVAQRGLLHITVRRADGTIEDPSARLGMRGKA